MENALILVVGDEPQIARIHLRSYLERPRSRTVAIAEDGKSH